MKGFWYDLKKDGAIKYAYLFCIKTTRHSLFFVNEFCKEFVFNKNSPHIAFSDYNNCVHKDRVNKLKVGEKCYIKENPVMKFYEQKNKYKVYKEGDKLIAEGI